MAASSGTIVAAGSPTIGPVGAITNLPPPRYKL
jgi:hypothetical protein